MKNSHFQEKIKCKLYGKNFKNSSCQQIIEEVETWKNLQVSIFWENLRSIKKSMIAESSALDFSYFIFPPFETTQVEKSTHQARTDFNFWEKHEEVSFSHELNFNHATFLGNVYFQNTLFKNSVNFSEINFEKQTNFSHSIFQKSVTFKKTQFRDESDFYHTEFLKKTRFDEATFHAKTVFHKSIFAEGTSFSRLSSKYRITFFSCKADRISFKYSRIENAYFINNQFQYLSLHGVAIQNPFFSDNEIDDAERETFAYIKHFFDNKNDYISANTYYAKEMRAYQRELFPKSNTSFFKKIFHWFNTPNFGDKLVFGFNKIASEFGQNIFLPLYWIVFSGTLFVGIKGSQSLIFITLSLLLFLVLSSSTFVIRKLFKKQGFKDLKWLLSHATLSFIVIGILLYHGTFIGDFAKVINPVQIFRGQGNYCQGIELSCLLLRVFIATMVYHFAIASKRGVKR